MVPTGLRGPGPHSPKRLIGAGPSKNEFINEPVKRRQRLNIK